MRFIGFSTSLTHDAPGHYKPFHLALNNEFQRIDPKSFYIGAETTDGNTVWWFPWAPKTLRTRPNYASRKKINDLKALLGNQEGLLINYEGRISHIFLLSYIARITNVQVLLNFHYTSELTKFTKSKIGSALFYRIICFGEYISNQKLIFTAESHQLSSELMKKIGREFPAFPIFSVLEKPNLSEIAKWKNEDFVWVVCRIKENSPESDSLECAIKNNPESHFLIHGLNANLANRYRKFPNVELQELYINLENYREKLFTCSSVILLYDTNSYRNHSSGRLVDCIIFEREFIVPKGMPIPAHLENSEFVDELTLDEIANMNFPRAAKPHNTRPSISPDAIWAVQELKDIFDRFDKKPAGSATSYKATFFILWIVSLLVRGIASVYFRIISFIPNLLSRLKN